MIDYALLGVTEQAGEREIKRAYAIRLKQTRPESDPEGYQRLREAFDAALAAARSREHAAEAGGDQRAALPVADADADADAEHEAAATDLLRPASKATPVPMRWGAGAADVPAPRVDTSIDLHALTGQLLQAAADGPDVFAGWLNDCPEFVSIESRQRLMQPLMHVLAEIAPPMPVPAVPGLLRFFAVDALALRDAPLARHVALIEARAAAHAKAQRKQELRRSEREGFFGRVAWRDLSQPIQPGRRLAILLLPGFQGPMRRLLAELEQGQQPFGSAPDPRPVAYWAHVLDPDRVSVWRFASKLVIVGMVVAIVRVFVGPVQAAGFAGVGVVCVITWALLALNDARKRRARPHS